MSDSEVDRLLAGTQEIKTEAAQLREATQDFAETLRRGLVRATIQGIALTFAAVIIAVSFLGYLTGKTWTCDPTVLRENTLSWDVCNIAFPQTTQQAKYLKATQDATAGVAAAQASQAKDVTEGVAILKRLEGVITEVQTRLNPASPDKASPTLKKVCAILRQLDPANPELEGCPAG